MGDRKRKKMANGNHGAQRREPSEPKTEVPAEPASAEPAAPHVSAPVGKPKAKPKPIVDGASSGGIGGPPPKTAFTPPEFAMFIGRGRSVTSPRGQLNEGAEVRETDFDAETLQRLKDKGVVVTRG